MVEIEHNILAVEWWVRGGGGRLVPGVYEVKVTEVKVEDARSGSGYQKLAMKCQVFDGEYMGAIAFCDRSLHPNALGYLRGMFDMLNVYANGRSFNEQKLVGRFMKVQVVEYTKQNGEAGLKAEKLFRSDINDGKNEQLDISEGAATVHPKPTPARPSPAPARPPAANGNGNGKATGTRPPASPPAAKKKSDDDLPF